MLHTASPQARLSFPGFNYAEHRHPAGAVKFSLITCNYTPSAGLHRGRSRMNDNETLNPTLHTSEGSQVILQKNVKL